MSKALAQLSLFQPDCMIMPSGRLLRGGFPSLTERVSSRVRRKYIYRRDLSAFSLGLLLSASTIIVATAGVLLNTISTDTPVIVSHSSQDDWEGWLPSLRNNRRAGAFRLNDPEYAQRIQAVSAIISSKHKVKEAHAIARSIVSQSEAAGLDPVFVAAVIKSESAFKPHARSNKGAVGLMQLLPATARYIAGKKELAWHGEHKLTDPEYNIKLGVAYFKYLLKMFNGNAELALIAYNWGPANLTQALKNRSHIPGSTIKYARAILGNHKRWRTQFPGQRAAADVVRISVG